MSGKLLFVLLAGVRPWKPHSMDCVLENRNYEKDVVYRVYSEG